MHGGIPQVVNPNCQALHRRRKRVEQKHFANSHEHISPDDGLEYLAKSRGPLILWNDAVLGTRAANLAARVVVFVDMLTKHILQN